MYKKIIQASSLISLAMLATYTTSAEAMKKNTPSIYDIQEAQNSPYKQPFVVTPQWQQQQVANQQFRQGPGHTTSVVFQGPNGTNTYYNPNNK